MGANDIKKIIRDRRIQLGLTMLDVSKAVGVSEATVSRWESGSIENMKLDKVELLAKVLRLPPSELMGWEDTKESVNNIINNRIKEMDMTLEQVAKKAGVSLYWLQNIDTFIPGEWGGENDIAYKWISQVAEVIELPGATLRAALALQEIPAYDGPTESPEEAFQDLIKKNRINQNDYVFDLQLKQLGYSIGFDEEDAYLWINYPDGTLEITEKQLDELITSSKSYLKFQLEELKHNNIDNFRKS